MAVNKNALIRYKTIDQCLQNRYRKWTLEDLIDACSDALYEYEGIEKGVSRRTVQADIQMMRSDKLGYNAPIVVMEKKYYTYEDEAYSITNIPLTNQDLEQLGEAISFLKQFRGFSHFSRLEGMVQKLEDHIYSKQENRPAVIDFEKNDLLKGIHYLETIYQAILQEKSLVIEYQSFRAKESHTFLFHPYLLKEYNNRWFLFGRKDKQKKIVNLALDRIEDLEMLDKHFKKTKAFSAQEYFRNVVGVTVTEQKTQKILLLVDYRSAPYLLTKPLHHSQKELEKTNEGVLVSLELQTNIELERALLSYGETVKVVQPVALRRRLQKRLQEALDSYNVDLSGKGLVAIKNKFEARGMARMDHLYTLKAFNKIKLLIEKEILPIFPEENAVYYMPDLQQNHKQLQNMLFNINLDRLIETMDNKLEFKYARLIRMQNFKESAADFYQQKRLYYPERNKAKGYRNWKSAGKGFEADTPQTVLDNTVVIQLFLSDSNPKNGVWKMLPGSFKKVLGQKEIDLIAENSISQAQEIQSGNIMVLRPLLLKKFLKGVMTKKVYILELVFS